MNIILFEKKQSEYYLEASDPRAKHIAQVLRRALGQSLLIGIINGPIISVQVTQLSNTSITLTPDLDTAYQQHPALHPISLIVGIPKPQVAKRIIEEASAIGAERIIFFKSDKGEPSYTQSKLWKDNNTQEFLRRGVTQAFSTYIPKLLLVDSLEDALSPPSSSPILALDIYEANMHLSDYKANMQPTRLCIGSERGWSKKERNILKSYKAILAHMGPRVLKVETAAACGLSYLIHAQ